MVSVFARRHVLGEMNIWAWADASPQEHTGEMFLSEFLLISKSCMADSFELSNLLANTGAELVSAIRDCFPGDPAHSDERAAPRRDQVDAILNILSSRAQLVHELSVRILRHVNLPQFLGSGASSFSAEAPISS
eukprot:7204136-Pyramimonas_sp.AAC.1